MTEEGRTYTHDEVLEVKKTAFDAGYKEGLVDGGARRERYTSAYNEITPLHLRDAVAENDRVLVEARVTIAGVDDLAVQFGTREKGTTLIVPRHAITAKLRKLDHSFVDGDVIRSAVSTNPTTYTLRRVEGVLHAFRDSDGADAGPFTSGKDWVRVKVAVLKNVWDD